MKMKPNTHVRKSLYAAGVCGTALLAISSAAAAATPDGGAAHRSSAPVTLNIFVGKNTSEPQVQDALMKRLITQFEKQNPDIRINWSAYDSASQENTTLQTSLVTRQGPDIFEFGSTLVPTAYSTRGFHVLTAQDWAFLGGKSKFFPAQLKLSGPNPRDLIAVPEYVLPFALVYNKTMFQKAGIKSPPATWNDFVADAKKLTIPAKDQWGVAMDPSDSFDPWHIGWVLTRQLGGNFVNPAMTKATLDSPASVKALTFWFDWMTKFKIASPQDVTYKGTDMLHAFENLHAAMLVMQGPTLIPSLDTSPAKGQYAFAPMPTVPYGMTHMPPGGVPVQTFVSGQYYAIPNYVKNTQDALKWIKFVTSVPTQRAFFQAYGYLPANISAYAGYAPLQTPEMKAFVQAENGAYPTPFTGAWGNLEVAYGGVSSQIANEIATNSYKPADILTKLQAANQQVQASLQP